MNAGSDPTFAEMARTYPMRTGIYTVVPLGGALAQFGNSYYHGFPPLYAGVFALLLLGFAVLITRHHLAAFRLARLRETWSSDE